MQFWQYVEDCCKLLDLGRFSSRSALYLSPSTLISFFIPAEEKHPSGETREICLFSATYSIWDERKMKVKF